MEREDLYDFQALSGEHISTNRDPILLPDAAPLDAEMRAAVKTVRNGRTGGGSMMEAEDLKGWLQQRRRRQRRQGTRDLRGQATHGACWCCY